MGWDPAEEHPEIDALLAAWALDAVMSGDEERIRAHIEDCEDCTEELARLREAVHRLDGPPAEPAKGARKGADKVGRGRLMAAARAARTGHDAPAAHAAPYAAAVASLEALLRELDGTPARWGTPVVHDWDVQGTVAHLIAADEPLAERLGLLPVTRAEPGGTGDAAPWEVRWAARTEEVVAYEHTRPPAETAEAWRTQAHGLLELPEAREAEPAALSTALMGRRLPVADHYVIRAFETWIHTRDIGRALGLVVPPPPPVHLRRLVALAVRILDLALGDGARPVLLAVEGEAGGDWVLGPAAEPVAAELVLEAVDLCLLVGGRLTPQEVSRGQAGDAAAAQHVLATAASLAWL
ncbi:maleylpyruvate isomerase family mycothiol-dependent enzyme [Streptomyces violens]|uniref:maleylpyruvate isomerase family mycothiol-dependent enzyme n=1 Tax=Streptomyces violens TaxID=66377 RepID=UPI0004BE644E|nr:maleylpyruvate isomerase family mycothiol-dependent enzyme [Streptomyces violens]